MKVDPMKIFMGAMLLVVALAIGGLLLLRSCREPDIIPPTLPPTHTAEPDTPTPIPSTVTLTPLVPVPAAEYTDTPEPTATFTATAEPTATHTPRPTHTARPTATATGVPEVLPVTGGSGG